MMTHAASSNRTSQTAQGDARRSLFREIAAMMEAATGNLFPESKSSLLQSRVSKRMVALRINDVDDYLTYLFSENNQNEREELIFALTTNVTRFFREPHHFEDLKDSVLPPLLSKLKSGGRVRIWSAGCSSGEEPYSIAMTALSLEPKLKNFDFKILATDINRNMVSRARKGTYSAAALSSIPVEYHAYVETDGSRFNMGETAKELISFRELNLLHDWPFAGSFDVIFCRNVVIYFSDDLSNTMWQRFATRLNTGGRLYAGHSERVRSPDALGLKPYGASSYEKL